MQDSASGDVPLTFGTVLPLIIEQYDLAPSSNVYTFTHVGRSDPLYDTFATARDYTMIGTATHPDLSVLCKHVMVLVGLAE